MEEFRMKLRVHMLVFATLATAALAFSQNPVTMDGPFQVRYASNLIVGPLGGGGAAVVNITNTGASASMILTGQIPPQNNINGSLCVNIYTYAADEQEVACCSCLVTPNALWSAGVQTGLLNSTLTPSFPPEVVIKLISTIPFTNAVSGVQSCNPAMIDQSAALPGSTGNKVPTPGFLANGLLAWGTSTHGFPLSTGPGFQIAETPFLPATLSTAELTRDVMECQFIQVLGSGQFGICKGCDNKGLGASAQ
jgi:hypothetical protein